MLKKLIVENDYGKQYTNEFNGLLTAPGVVTDVPDLGPVQAAINITQYAATDGAIYNSSRLAERSLSMTIVLVQGSLPTLEHARRELYDVFAPRVGVVVTVVTDTGVYKSYGYVEKCEPTIFSERESMSVTMVCPDPYWYTDFDKTEIVATTEGGFEFPFACNGDMEKYFYKGTEITPEYKRIVGIRGKTEKDYYVLTDYDGYFGVFMDPIISEKPATDDEYVSFINKGLFSKDQPTSPHFLSPLTANEYLFLPKWDNEIEWEGVKYVDRFQYFTDYNNSIVIPPRLRFGNLKKGEYQEVLYTGSLTNGITIRTTLHNGVDSFPMISYSDSVDQSQKLVVDMRKVKDRLGRNFRSGDVLEIRTKDGDKGVFIWDSSNGMRSISCLNSVGPEPYWPKIRNGKNIFRFLVFGGAKAEPMAVSHELIFDVKTEGV